MSLKKASTRLMHMLKSQPSGSVTDYCGIPTTTVSRQLKNASPTVRRQILQELQQSGELEQVSSQRIDWYSVFLKLKLQLLAPLMRLFSNSH